LSPFIFAAGEIFLKRLKTKEKAGDLADRQP
jgi:hypothetical protein